MSVEVASKHHSSFNGGVFFIPLDEAAVTHERFLETLRRHLRLPLAMDDAPEKVFNWLAGRAALLVLDNFEQSIDDSVWVARLLDAAPQVKILATSQVSLGLQQEWLVRVGGLLADDADSAAVTDAMRLFVGRARQVQPGFQIADHEQTVRDICKSL